MGKDSNIRYDRFKGAASMSFEGNLSYLKELASAGFNGAASARRESKDRPSPAWLVVSTPTAMGALLGAFRSHRFGKRKSPSAIAIGGLVGGLVGCGAGLAWASRGYIGLAARGAARSVQAARDAHWLQANPINYA